ncbi:MAG: hypothetical protein NZ899_12935 [Thermoguttaceae bacterium]|nr:hypothetical protein [Thermoguttaceae bacterium]MDW8079975.1 hypothetical protein [Thermoguttaceae bacterium]
MLIFELSRRQMIVRNFLRRLLDVTCPTLPPLEGERRREERIQRVIPVLIIPWEKDGPVVDEAGFGLTKDFGDCSVAVILPQPFKAVEAALGVWLEGPNYLRGTVEQNSPIGGGFWQIGLVLERMIPVGDYPALEKLATLASRLVPRKVSEPAAVK